MLNSQSAFAGFPSSLESATSRLDAKDLNTVTRSYDGLGRQYLTNTNGVLVNSSFDAYGRAVTQSTPHTSGETAYNTVTTYDALGRPKTVTAPDGTVTTRNLCSAWDFVPAED